jgi:hypothetical protein
MRTSELSGTALDWAVAKCEQFDNGDWLPDYSTDWAHGGPIIEREGMGVWMYQWNEQGEPENGWYAEDKNGDHVRTGTTPLVAAMRCYVASKLGDEVEIPEGL